MAKNKKAPSRNVFCKGLGWRSRARIELTRKDSLVFLDGDTLTLASLALLFVGSAETICEIAKLLGRRKELTVRPARFVHFSPLKVLFSTAKLRQRLSVFQIPDNTANVAYYGFKVKLKQKTGVFADS